MQEDKINKKLEFLMRASAGFRGLLYDCDGTLADNMGDHKEAFVRVAAERGFVFDPAIIDELAGWPIEDVVLEVNRRYKQNFDPEAFSARKNALFHSEYLDKTRPVEHVVRHLKANAGKAKIAVVSGSEREAVERTLQRLGIASLVELLVCAGETPRAKPFPDPFLRAAEFLNLSPADCLVFEDGEAGTRAAEAAGMKWLRIDQV